MNKFRTALILLPIILILALAQTVSAADSVVAAPTSVSLFGNVGQASTGGFVVTNTGDTGMITFSNTLLTMSGTSYSVPISSISAFQLDTGQAQPVNFSAQIASDQYAGTYNGTITITRGTANAQVNVQLNVNETLKTFSLNDLSIIGVAGQQTAGTTTLSNTANSNIGSVNIALSDLTSPAGSILYATYIMISPSSPMALNYKEAKTLTITANIPATQAAGTYNGTITASYGTTTKTARLTITISPQTPHLTLSTPNSITWAKGIDTAKTTTFSVINDGNLDLTELQISANVPNNLGITISPSPSTLDLAKGETKTITLTTYVPATQAAGAYTGIITISGANVTAQTPQAINVRDPSYSLSVPARIDLGNKDTPRNTTITQSFTITNDGDYDILNLKINATGVNSKYNMQVSPSTISSLGRGASTTVTITSYVPAESNSGSTSIGSLLYTYQTQAGASLAKTSALYMTSQDLLEMYKVRAIVDGQGSTVGNGQVIGDDAKPGSTLKIEVEMKNSFSTETDTSIRRIRVTTTVVDLDDGGDVEKESGEFSLRPGKRNTVTFDFKVPSNTEERDFDIIIEAEGEDDNGAMHTAEHKIYLNVVRKNHDLRINTFTFEPAVIKCGGIVNARVKVTNEGSTYEDEVALNVSSSQLGINIYEPAFELANYESDDDYYYERDNVFDKTYQIFVPRGTMPGSYLFYLRVFYDTEIQYDYASANLIVEDCSAATPTQPTEPTTPGQVVVVTPTAPTLPGAGSTIAQPSFMENTWFVVLLIAGIVIVLGGLLVIVYKMAARK